MCMRTYMYKHAYRQVRQQVRHDHILQRDRGCHRQDVTVNKQMLVSSLITSEANGMGSFKSIIRIAVEGCVLCSTKVTMGTAYG